MISWEGDFWVSLLIGSMFVALANIMCVSVGRSHNARHQVTKH